MSIDTLRVLTRKISSPSVIVNGGAISRWSPLMPSAVPFEQG
jgi:hypothetical protein